jgi:hypothetical protein
VLLVPLGNKLTELVYNPLEIVAQFNHALHVAIIFTLFLALVLFLFAVTALRTSTVGLHRRLTFRTGAALATHRATKDANIAFIDLGIRLGD